MSTPITELDYDVIREPWNRYELEDGSHLKIRYILIGLTRKEESGGKGGYGIKGQNIVDLHRVPISMKGPPADRQYNPEELMPNIINDDVRYSTLNEEWNEYVAEDGAKIKVKITLVSVAKTNKFNMEGDPIYITKTAVLPQIMPPKR